MKLGDVKITPLGPQSQRKDNGAGNQVVVPEILPDLDKIEVAEISESDLDELRKESKERKHWAENAGIKLSEIETRIVILEADPELEFSAKAQDVLAKLKSARDQLLGIQDESTRNHLRFSQLLNDVKGCVRESAEAIRGMLMRVIHEKRYWIPDELEKKATKDSNNGKWPPGTIFFEDKTYFSFVGEDGRSNGQRALEAELRKLVDAFKKSEVGRIADPVRANHDLSGFEKRVEDNYYFFSPARENNGRRFSEGHAIVQLYDRNKDKDRKGDSNLFVRFSDAVGSLRWTTKRRERNSIPFFWVEKGRVITKPENHLEANDERRSQNMINLLRAITLRWVDENKPKPKPEKPKKKASAKKKTSAKKKSA